MSRTHASQDVYVGDDLRWKQAMVIEQHEHSQITVKAKHPTRPNAWENALVLTGVKAVGSEGEALFWTGLDAQGEQVQLAAVPRETGGCGCGG